MYNRLEKYSKLFLDLLFELNNNGGNFSDSDIRDEVVTMMTGVNIYVVIVNIFYIFVGKMS